MLRIHLSQYYSCHDHWQTMWNLQFSENLVDKHLKHIYCAGWNLAEWCRSWQIEERWNVTKRISSISKKKRRTCLKTPESARDLRTKIWKILKNAQQSAFILAFCLYFGILVHVFCIFILIFLKFCSQVRSLYSAVRALRRDARLRRGLGWGQLPSHLRGSGLQLRCELRRLPFAVAEGAGDLANGRGRLCLSVKVRLTSDRTESYSDQNSVNILSEFKTIYRNSAEILIWGILNIF